VKEYKMRRGEYLEERLPDLRASVEEHFGAVSGTETVEGHELYAVEDPDNPVFERVLAGAASYEGKKDRIAVEFHERDAAEVIAEGNADAAEAAVDTKNEFLLAATGRDAKSRRESMKRDVEDDAPDVA
jgi:type III secretion system FlhB-like substrate exporter